MTSRPLRKNPSSASKRISRSPVFCVILSISAPFSSRVVSSVSRFGEAISQISPGSTSFSRKHAAVSGCAGYSPEYSSLSPFLS